MLEGAPKKTRLKPVEKAKARSQYHRSLVVLLVLGALVLVGAGGFAAAMAAELSNGVLKQREQARRRPDWVPLRALPPYVPAAFAAVVDTSGFRTLPTHGRLDRPVLTRDLVRQVHRLDGLAGEAKELAMAPILELQTTPRGLLELYLNRVYLGRTENWPLYGLFHASQEFFGKDPRQLTLGEAATLAGILFPPRLRDPEANPGAVGTRRNEVLRLMLQAGDITPEHFRAAVREPLGFQPGLDYAPMSRPADWRSEPAVIRLPPELSPLRDSLRAQPAP